MSKRFKWLAVPLLVGAISVASVSLAAGETLVIAQGVDIVTVDPNNQNQTPTANVLLNIFDTMYRRQADGSLIPWMVTAKSVNPTTWDLTVKQGVKFHNGEELDAEVIKFNFDRLIDPAKPLVISNNWSNIAKVDVVNPTTVRLTTKTPFPAFLTRLTGLFVMPKKYVESGNAFLQTPIGTGPYKFVKWTKDQSFEMEANPSYWGGEPKIKKVVFRPIPEASSRVAELVSGGVDIITNLVPEAVATVKGTNAAEVRTVPSVRNIFLILNTREGASGGPLANQKVRLALNYAVDKKTIVQTVLGGFGYPTGCPLNSYIFGYDKAACTPYEYNMARAKQLLAEAGYPNGFSITLGSPNGRYLNDRQVAEAIVGQWAKIGVKAELRVTEWSTYVGGINNRKVPTDAVLLGWGNNEFDADGTLYTLFYAGTVKGGPPPSLFGYVKLPVADQYIVQARTTLDQEVRKDAYAKALKVLRAEVPWVFLHQQEDLYGVSKRVDWKPRGDERIIVADMAFKP